MRRPAVGVEVGGSVIALDDGHGATGSEQRVENRQRVNGPRQVLQNKTDKHVIEGFGGKGQGEDVRLPELEIGESRHVHCPFGFLDRVGGHINRGKVCIRAALS